MNIVLRTIGLCTLAAGIAQLGGCALTSTTLEAPTQDSKSHTQKFFAGSQATCNAAQHVMLQQGYALAQADATALQGKLKKHSASPAYTEITLQVACEPDNGDREAIVHVNAMEDRYAFASEHKQGKHDEEETLTLVSSEPITNDVFFGYFFSALDRTLGAKRPKRVTSIIDSNTIRDSHRRGQ